MQVLGYAEEKIGLAQQIYDYVDARIRRLDADLATFQADISRERARLGIPVRLLFACAMSPSLCMQHPPQPSWQALVRKHLHPPGAQLEGWATRW
jgi:hypothetical protein